MDIESHESAMLLKESSSRRRQLRQGLALVYWHGVMGSVENEWYGTTAGSEVDVLIVQSNYPEGLEGVPVIVPARGAKWAFSEIYGRLAALQAAGAAPIIEAWLAGELPLTSFP